MTIDAMAQDLAAELEETLRQLESYRRTDDASVPAEALPSLLQQCQEICDGLEQPAPLRSLHHFACSGGTVIAKCISALPNSIVVSEIDPLSTMGVNVTGWAPRFAPTDLILGLRHAARAVDDAIFVEIFKSSINAAHAGLSKQGYNLVLRDHAHSHFCTNTDAASRPSLHEILVSELPLRSVVTVRHPLDSFLSLTANGWLHFEPATLDEYSRRYLAFLDRHVGVPVVLYEDFVQAPEQVLEQLCSLLDLPFSPLALDFMPVIRMTGDSGRSGGRISARRRRDVPQELDQDRNDSHDYHALCARFGYDP
ncbi:hypothetical protein SAMN04488043_11626 [Thalassovita gelatinovora]|uniref:hypothetical protein n=1 Tax=Thalassovita gelatinovora TaxID=53501 RepID=UPI0008B529C3|nr:hypothetical protein [Thalassovita gelatinovora]QIZ82672.1 sulfotransferase [Thalassovita gelatinovora]SER11388.1 hypothetical protein SAMN04488043_11626 [Thalassovita gelatinovora]